MKAFRTILSAAVLALSAGQAVAQAQNPAWVDQLVGQIAEDLRCEVGYLISMREYELGGRQVEEARVQCVDGRRFDASRAAPDPLFTFKECGEQVC